MNFTPATRTCLHPQPGGYKLGTARSIAIKASELFVVTALILFVFALVAPFFSPVGLGISINLRNTGYILPPSTVAIASATAFCFFATVYSLWMLPLNRVATLLHFWLTAVGTAVFWLAFYRAAAALANSRAAIWILFGAPAVVILTQLIFVWNLIQAFSKMTRLHS